MSSFCRLRLVRAGATRLRARLIRALPLALRARPCATLVEREFGQAPAALGHVRCCGHPSFRALIRSQPIRSPFTPRSGRALVQA